eukprot:5527145-Prymnesium_polylepis.4
MLSCTGIRTPVIGFKGYESDNHCPSPGSVPMRLSNILTVLASGQHRTVLRVEEQECHLDQAESRFAARCFSVPLVDLLKACLGPCELRLAFMRPNTGGIVVVWLARSSLLLAVFGIAQGQELFRLNERKPLIQAHPVAVSIASKQCRNSLRCGAQPEKQPHHLPPIEPPAVAATSASTLLLRLPPMFARTRRDRSSDWCKIPEAPCLLVDAMQVRAHRQYAGAPTRGTTFSSSCRPRAHTIALSSGMASSSSCTMLAASL